MRYKSIPANPMEITKIRMLFNVPTSAKMILDSGCVDTLCYIIPEGTFYIEKVDSTGDFNKDYKITKKVITECKSNKKIKNWLIMDEIDKYPENFLDKPIREEAE